MKNNNNYFNINLKQKQTLAKVQTNYNLHSFIHTYIRVFVDNTCVSKKNKVKSKVH